MQTRRYAVSWVVVITLTILGVLVYPHTHTYPRVPAPFLTTAAMCRSAFSVLPAFYTEDEQGKRGDGRDGFIIFKAVYCAGFNCCTPAS